jgi:hypothetical protein
MTARNNVCFPTLYSQSGLSTDCKNTRRIRLATGTDYRLKFGGLFGGLRRLTLTYFIAGPLVLMLNDSVYIDNF